MRYLSLPAHTGFANDWNEMELRFYQGPFLKSVDYHYSVNFSFFLVLAKLQN